MMMAAAAAPGPGPGPGAGPGSGSVLGAVSLTVSSTLNSFRAHKRYGTGLTIAELKCKLELLVGSPASCMALELYGPREELLAQLDQDEALLGSYPVADGCRLHVIDGSGARRGEFEDVSRVQKYEMDDSDYDRRPDSLRSFLRRRGWGRYSGGSPGGGSPEGESPGGGQEQVTPLPPLGSRCQVRVPGQPTKRGTIVYVGQTDFKPGPWVGVQYDEPLGKHDGSVNGRRYFQCPPKYGAFVRPHSVTPGDFPEEEEEEDGLEDEL